MGFCCFAYIFAEHTLYIFHAELAHPMGALFIAFVHSENAIGLVLHLKS